MAHDEVHTRSAGLVNIHAAPGGQPPSPNGFSNGNALVIAPTVDGVSVQMDRDTSEREHKDRGVSSNGVVNADSPTAHGEDPTVLPGTVVHVNNATFMWRYVAAVENPSP